MLLLSHILYLPINWESRVHDLPLFLRKRKTDTRMTTTPSISTIRRMLYDRRWNDVQDAIRSDATVSMRINDPVDDGRRLEGAIAASSRRLLAESSAEIVGDDDNACDRVGDGDINGVNECVARSHQDIVQLRYWVGRPGDGEDDRDAASVFASREAFQRRTLLHSLCRLDFPAAVGISDASSRDADLAGAVRTAAMLIAASHNCPFDDASNDYMVDDDDDDEIMDDGNDKGDNRIGCKNSRRHYCPALMLPPVDRRCHEEGTQRNGGDDDDEATTTTTEMVVHHTSVLTMTDAMGETPLHALTGVGSCHIDLVRTFVKACSRRVRNRHRDRCSPSDGSQHDNSFIERRRPTVYDLLVAQNYHGCTPLHFLAGGSYIKMFV